MRIAICVHVFERVDFDVYFNHLFCVAKWGKKYDLVFIGKSGLDAAQARNGIIQTALDEKCTHAFFLDGDHLISPTSLDYLLESKDEAMVSGLICKKGEGFQQVGWEIKKDEAGVDKYYALTLPVDGKLYEVSVCAFGCTLINLEKIQKLQPPYFKDTCDNGVLLRSDVNLCNAFRNIGEKMWTDTRVLVGHLGVKLAIYPQGAEQMVQLTKMAMDSRRLHEGQSGNYYVVAGESHD